jgi:hypothetical protein
MAVIPQEKSEGLRVYFPAIHGKTAVTRTLLSLATRRGSTLLSAYRPRRVPSTELQLQEVASEDYPIDVFIRSLTTDRNRGLAAQGESSQAPYPLHGGTNKIRLGECFQPERGPAEEKLPGR